MIADTIQSMNDNLKNAYDKITDNDRRNLLDNEKIIINASCGYGSVNIAPDVSYNKLNRATILPDDAIECLPNTKYTLIIPDGYRVAVGFLTENKIGLGDTGWQTSSTYIFTTKPNSKYIACNFSLVSDGTVDNSIKYQPFMIALGENISYQPYLPPKNLSNLSTTLETNINSAFDKVLEKGGKLESKNILNIKDNLYATQSGIAKTYNDDNSLTISGTATSTWSYVTKPIDKIIEIGTYTLSISKKLDYNIYVNLTYEDDTSGNFIIAKGNTKLSFTTNKVAKTYIVIVSNLTTNASYNDIIYIQLEKGTEPTEYQPYELEKNLTNLIKAIDSIPTN